MRSLAIKFKNVDNFDLLSRNMEPRLIHGRNREHITVLYTDPGTTPIVCAYSFP